MYVIILAVSAIILILFYIFKSRDYSFYNEHLLVTGGSSGIGLALAIEAVSRGASVTLVARNQERLASAQELVKKHVQKDQKVLIFAADITAGLDSLEDVVKKWCRIVFHPRMCGDGCFIDRMFGVQFSPSGHKLRDHAKNACIYAWAQDDAGPITYLINCAGICRSYRFDETPIDDFQGMMNINYFGSVYMTRAVLPYMKTRRKGKIVFVSSLAGLVGLYGFSSYAASKFAITGMAQALQMEVLPYGISVTVSFPPDTDTPGFAEENISKPLETKLISGSAGLFTPSAVAAKILKDVMNEQFMSSVGFEGWLLCILCSGMSPVSSLGQLILQALTMGVLRLVSYSYRVGYEKIITRCMTEEKNKHQ